MITAYVGRPGSGKSYDAVNTIINNLMLRDDGSRRRVYTNIEGMDDDKCRKVLQIITGMDDYEFNKYFHYVSDKRIESFWEFVKDGSLIVIDEIHKRFNCRDWSDTKNRQFADWCSTHRHHGFDLIMLTQDIEKVEKQTRTLIEWTNYYKKINFVGSMISNKYLVFNYDGYEVNGQSLGKQVKSYNKRVFQCYKSHASKDVKELGIGRGINILRHPVFYAIPVVVSIFLYFLFTKSSFAKGDLFGASSIGKKHAVVQAKNGPVIPSDKPSIAAPSIVPVMPPVPPLMHGVQAVMSSAKNPVGVSGGGPGSSMFGKPQRPANMVIGCIDYGNVHKILLSDGRTVQVSRKVDVGQIYE